MKVCLCVRKVSVPQYVGLPGWVPFVPGRGAGICGLCRLTCGQTAKSAFFFLSDLNKYFHAGIRTAYGLINFCLQLALSDQTRTCEKEEDSEKERSLDGCMLFCWARFSSLA